MHKIQRSATILYYGICIYAMLFLVTLRGEMILNIGQSDWSLRINQDGSSNIYTPISNLLVPVFTPPQIFDFDEILSFVKSRGRPFKPEPGYEIRKDESIVQVDNFTTNETIYFTIKRELIIDKTFGKAIKKAYIDDADLLNKILKSHPITGLSEVVFSNNPLPPEMGRKYLSDKVAPNPQPKSQPTIDPSAAPLQPPTRLPSPSQTNSPKSTESTENRWLFPIAATLVLSILIWFLKRSKN